MKIKQIIKNIIPERLIEWYRICRDNIWIARKYREIDKIRSKYVVKSEKIKIVFIVQRIEVFNAIKSIYRAACEREDCEIYFLPFPRCENDQKKMLWDTYEEVVSFCEQQGKGTVLPTYDFRAKKFFDLRRIMPDYIFLNTPYEMQFPEGYSLESLALIGKVCYVPYGYNLSEAILPIEYSRSLLGNADYLFLAGDPAYSYCSKLTRLSGFLHGKKTFDIGYPKLDLITKSEKKDKTTLLYLPRWTVASGAQNKNEQSSFLWVYDKLIGFAMKHPEIDIIIRPHPLMFENFLEHKVMSKKEVDNIIETVNNCGNIFLDSSSEYVNTLKKADIFISDYTSMLMEFYPIGKPIIYLGSKYPFMKYNKEIFDTFYHITDWKQLELCLNKLLAGRDSKRGIRNEKINLFMTKCNGNAGRKILDMLFEDLRKTRYV